MANVKWVATKAEADKLAADLTTTHWGIEVNKTNKANKKHPAGTYFVRWGEKKKGKP